MEDRKPFAPINFETGRKPGQWRTIGNTVALAEWLLNEWTGDTDGEAYQTALKVCLWVLDGQLPADDAREAFKASLTEAGLFFRE
ncbi:MULTISPECIES: DUF982 domain-containing protein [unclassified Sinorhizobium]|uniref:DUF982 domain-containing protein n=1 Tax=unclassified Sinorhizobium TaxID=2613772 RepID=UPI003524DDAD